MVETRKFSRKYFERIFDMTRIFCKRDYSHTIPSKKFSIFVSMQGEKTALRRMRDTYQNSEAHLGKGFFKNISDHFDRYLTW